MRGPSFELKPRSPTFLQLRKIKIACAYTLQGWAKEWTLGCVNPASWLPLVAGGEFTQPRDHSLAQHCTSLSLFHPAAVRKFGVPC